MQMYMFVTEILQKSKYLYPTVTHPWTSPTELYYFLEEQLAIKKCRQKHGGFWPLLTPHGTYGYRYLPLTNRNAMLLTKSFAPLVFAKKIYGFLVFGTKSSRKIFSFSLVDTGTCKNNEKMFLLTDKS